MVAPSKTIKLLLSDKPFLFACAGLIIVLVFFNYHNNRKIVTRPSVAERILKEVNQRRISRGLEILTSDTCLAEIARQHSLKMAAGMVPIGHDNSSQRFAAIAQAGIAWIIAAENVAQAARFEDPVTKAMHCWLNCKTDQQNLEGNFNRTGISVVQSKAKGDYFITQIYIKVP
jgi:uncharacterized protein YkwD